MWKNFVHLYAYMKKKLPKNLEKDFNEVLQIIEKAKENAFVAVNHELIAMYWEIGKYVSNKVKINAWGKGVVEHKRLFSTKCMANEAIL